MQNFLNLLKYILIGIVQGIAEIFPISSSGHLALLYKLLNISNTNQLELTIYLHFASSLALIVFFKNDLKNIIKDFFSFILKKDKNAINNFKLCFYLIIATIPATIIGLLIKPIIEKALDNVIFVGIGFVITSIILLLYNKLIQYNKDYSIKSSFIIGIFQAFAILPGISRSATTLLGAKVSKIDEEKSKKFIFLLLIIISFGGTFSSLIENKFSFNEMTILYIITMIIAFIFTYISLSIFFKKSLKNYYFIFSIYLLIISAIIFFISWLIV